MQIIIDSNKLGTLKALIQQIESIKFDPEDYKDDQATMVHKMEAIEGCIAQFNQTAGKCIRDINGIIFGED